MVVKLSATATIDVDNGTDYPILTITDGPLTVLVMPGGPSEGDAIRRCDTAIGSDLVLAASHYRNALSEAYAAQEGEDLPRRGLARRLLEERQTGAVDHG